MGRWGEGGGEAEREVAVTHYLVTLRLDSDRVAKGRVHVMVQRLLRVRSDADDARWASEWVSGVGG